MKKQILSVAIAFCLILGMIPANATAANETSVWDGSIAAGFAKGKGTESKPYIIQTASELAYLAESVNDGSKYSGEFFTLESDLDLSNIPWTPIGNSSCSFGGFFDGGSHTIKNLAINRPADDYIGLFGRVDYRTSFQKLSLTNVSISGSNNVGGLIGGTAGIAHITDCNISGKVDGFSRVGGMIGSGVGVKINNCINNATVSATSAEAYCGGVLGYGHAAEIISCINTGSVQAPGFAGGIVGYLVASTDTPQHTGCVVNCINLGSVGSADCENAGGIAGYGWGGYIYNSANLGDVQANDKLGGICAGGHVKNCYNAGQVKGVSNKTYAGGIYGFNGKVSNSYVLSATAEDLVGDDTDDSGASFVQAINTSDFQAKLNANRENDWGIWLRDDHAHNGAPYFEPRTVKWIWIGKQPQKTSYIEGETFDPSGLEVRAFCTDGSSYELCSCAYTITPAGGTALKQSNNAVKVFFSTSSGNLTNEFPITVEKAGAKEPSSWAADTVKSAIADNLVPQNLQSNYTTPTTRAEFCALATALYESVMGSITERQTFSDTTDANVEKMAALGVVNGVGDNRFSPNDKLTREQAATMLARLASVMGKPLPGQASTFADGGSVSEWARNAVGQMQASGIMGGVGNNTFSPNGEYTREQSIVTMTRLQAVVKQ